MRAEIDLYVERQSVLPGEEVRGRLLVRGVSSARSLTVSLQGEEVLGTGSLLRSFVYPVVDEVRNFGAPRKLLDFEQAFSFRIPPEAPPSYASRDLRCQYYLKARLHLGGHVPLGRLGGDTIRRLHITVLPPDRKQESRESARELVLEEEGLRLVATLECSSLSVGESLRGRLVLAREAEDTPLPTRLTFRLAAIEESLEPAYQHRQVLWVESQEVEPDAGAESPLEGNFVFPVPKDAPFSGEWSSFRLHYGFRVGMSLRGGRQVRESLPVFVQRTYVPSEEGLGIA